MCEVKEFLILNTKTFVQNSIEQFQFKIFIQKFKAGSSFRCGCFL